MKHTLSFQNQEVIEITCEDARAVFAPQHGARLLFWEVAGRRIIHWPDQADWSKPAKIRGGNPILFPFIARHFYQGIPEKWQDDAGVVRSMPSHGFCREAAFEVIPEEDENCLRMRLTDSDQTTGYYPYSFIFEVIYRLQPASLEVEFAVTNSCPIGDRLLPYYAGHHFYFAIPSLQRGDWKLDLPFITTARQTALGEIVESPNTELSTTLDQAQIVDRFHIQPTQDSIVLQNTETGEGILFELKLPESVPWMAVTTWTEKAESDFYCVEPWLGLPNAIAHGFGLRHIPPGKTERSICRLSVS